MPFILTISGADHGHSKCEDGSIVTVGEFNSLAEAWEAYYSKEWAYAGGKAIVHDTVTGTRHEPPYGEDNADLD